MLPFPRLHSFRSVLVLSGGVLLGACATPSPRPGFAGGAWGFDTESASRARYAASLKGVGGLATSATVRTTASQIAFLAPSVLLLFRDNEAELDQLELALLDCVQRAEREINSERFGNRSPTFAECRSVVGTDACGRPLYQSMELGNLKHAHALACIQDILRELWPAPVSIEQRYRYYRQAKVVETISREEEKRLMDEGCSHELRGTIKPDVVLHSNHDLLRAVLILDLKFPCPADGDSRWTKYGNTSVYNGSSQNLIYQEALGGKALRLSPEGISE